MRTPDTNGESATVVETELPLARRLVSEDAHLMAEPSKVEGEENGAHTVNVDETDMANTHSCIP